MGRQDGIIKVKGQVGGLSFYKTADEGYLIKQKSAIDGKRIKNDAAFARTRENGAEFGRAGAAGKLLKAALNGLIKKASDSRMIGRLIGELVKVIKADQTNLRGLRNVVDGEAELLTGFEFNKNAQLTGTFSAPYTSTIDRAAGSLSINIPAFIPNEMINAPQGATHFRLFAAGLEVDFENGTYVVNASQSPEIFFGPQQQAAIALAHAVSAASTKPLFLVFGIEFRQLVNGQSYAMNNGAFNALAIIKIDGGV